MSRSIVLLVTEGDLEIPVAAKMLGALGIGTEGMRCINKQGCHRFWREIERYNRAARHVGLVLGLADLEFHPCPSGLIARHLKHGRAPDFVLRIAEPMLESWLLADRESLADYLGVSPSAVPGDPESLPHPKRTLVDVARHSPKKLIREDIVPPPGVSSFVGRGYRTALETFIRDLWRPRVAAEHSSSLRKAIEAIRRAASKGDT